MSDEQKRKLEKQLWAVANVLRGKMNADEYKNYILGFIFYKYLSEKLLSFINDELLVKENYKFEDINENSEENKNLLQDIKNECIEQLGYFLKPKELFEYIVKKGKGDLKGEDKFIVEDLKNALNT